MLGEQSFGNYNTAHNNIHRETLRRALQLGVAGDASFRELKTNFVFMYLVGSTFHDLMQTTYSPVSAIDTSCMPWRHSFLITVRVADYRRQVEWERPTTCIPIQKFHKLSPVDEANVLLVEQGFLDIMRMTMLTREHFLHINPVLDILRHITIMRRDWFSEFIILSSPLSADESSSSADE